MGVVALVAACGTESRLAEAQPRDALVYDVPVDAAVTGSALTVWLGSELLKDRLAATTCRWCDVNGLDSGIRSSLRWTDHARSAVTASNLAAYAVAPAVGLGLMAWGAAQDHRIGELWVDALLMTQTVALAGSLNQLVKFKAGRQRPFAHAALPNPDPQQGHADENLSFYSGHTSFTFSLAAAGGAIATLRGYRWASAIWLVGGLVAATTGYLRIAADQHYFTDVLTGALIGASVGLAVPCTLHKSSPRDESASIAVVPSPGGAALVYGGAW